MSTSREELAARLKFMADTTRNDYPESRRTLYEAAEILAATPKEGVNATDDSLAKTVTTAVLSALKAGGDNLAIFNAVKQALPSVLGGVDQQETQTTKPSPSSAAATATETALERIVRAWDLIVSGQPAAASEFVPQYVADNWAASFATFACDELRKATQCNEQSGKQLSPAWQPIETAPRDGQMILACSTNHSRVSVVGWSQHWEDEPHWDDAGSRNAMPSLYMNANFFTHWMPLPSVLPQTNALPPGNAGLVSGGGK